MENNEFQGGELLIMAERFAGDEAVTQLTPPFVGPLPRMSAPRCTGPAEGGISAGPAALSVSPRQRF
jgi:hypothetical protein